ncbi:TetR/AcrR family transcriptional regulator [Crossiella sp. SN42]|uniref:TetR/AcrR family transcriptional regulator n=1 Tax=Crossiella sp. SN42 TaxID=2944808 RepID=UPI00207C8F12|nr:TetR/AcrR family transcriptional regulator [Crossiella sp. SN42]MCO1577575.1 TetR/AcrR family transcriptional regulator [Crossiella sp. SN42]
MSAADNAGTKPLRADAARNRAQILDAATEAFRERGLEVDVREIARLADVGMGTLYRHFSTKKSLVEAALEAKIVEWEQRAAAARNSTAAWDGLRALIEHTIELMAANRAFLDGLTVAESAVEACQGHLKQSLGDLVERAHEEGSLRADVSAGDIGLFVLSFGPIVLATKDSESDAWRRLLAVLLDGLRAA